MDIIAKKERLIIKLIREKLIRKSFINKKLSLQILIKSLIHVEEKYDLAMIKASRYTFKPQC